jgi:cytochrome o ubiquinol oxidase subunit 2
MIHGPMRPVIGCPYADGPLVAAQMPPAVALMPREAPRPVAHRVLPRPVLLAAVCAGLAGCQSVVLDPQGPVGAAENKILIDSLIIMLAIVIPTILATVGFAWWFRASNTRARHLPDWAYSGRIELVTWSIPVLVVLFLGGLSWTGSHDLDPAKPLASDTKPVQVQVVSLDWKWLFIYPDQHIASVNQLVIPAGTPVHFALTSASVMNAFFIPQLGSMIYTMNGMATQLNLQADHEGTYHGLSSHYSGDGFSDMYFDVRAVSAGDFQQWVTKAQANGPALDGQSYNNFARQSSNVAPYTFRTADAGLFEAIVSQKLPPGPGPQTGSPSVDVSPRRGG